jgi:TIR domain
MKYFISHESFAIEKAIKLKELLLQNNNEHEIFLTSDWDSLASGNIWMSDIFTALQECDELIVLITREDAFKNLWINFEVGAAIGRKKKPKIFICGEINLDEMKYPIKGIHCIGTWDTNRWVKELDSLGYKKIDQKPFAELFKQVNYSAIAKK